RNEKKHKTVAARLFFGNAKRIKCFARAAGHYQLAAVVGFEMLVGFGDGFGLVRSKRFLFSPRFFTVNSLFEAFPIDRSFAEVVKIYARDRRVLILYSFFCIWALPVCGRDPKAVSEPGSFQLFVLEMFTG